MTIIQPRHVLCVLHHASTPVRKLATEAGCEYDAEFSQSAPDSRMRNAFEACADRLVPSMSDEDWAAIESHTAVSYVLSPRLTPQNSMEVSARMLNLVGVLFRAGALAVKEESSGITHGRKRWVQLEADASKDRDACQLRAWVRLPIRSGAIDYSVGMHLLGTTDVEIEHANTIESERVDTMDMFLHYLVVDKPANLQPGHTFRVAADARRFRLSRERCTRYEADDFFHNPYGYWRLSAMTQDA